MATFTGTAGNDTITPGLVSAGVTRDPAGSFPGFADDSLDGGAGNDSLDGGGGADTLIGGSGNNTLLGGAGEDSLFSAGGIDKVNGGTEVDSWTGDYSAAGPLSFTWNAHTGAGTLSNGTTLTSIETVDLTLGTDADVVTITGGYPASGRMTTITTGDGDDTITIRGGLSNILAGNGNDTLTLDLSYLVGISPGFSLSGNGNGGCDGVYSSGYFHDVEHVSVLGTGNGDSFSFIDAKALAEGATVSIDGRGGIDLLGMDFREVNDIAFSVSSTGAISSSYGSFARVEQFYIWLGGGSNTVTTGGRADTVVSTIGVDKIDGGGGVDTWIGAYDTATAPISFTYNAATGSGTVSNGTTLSHIEQLTLSTGAGNDTVTINGNVEVNGAGLVQVNAGDGDDLITVRAGAAYIRGDGGIYGHDGSDRLVLDFAADTHADSVTLTDYGSTMYGSYNAFGATVPGQINEIEHVTVVGGSGNDTFAGASAADSFSGGAGDDSLSGGGGNDSLIGGAGTDTLEGGVGDDVYTVADSLDTIIENAGEGTDGVRSAISFSLASIANVENLTLTGTATIDATGNALANALTGNAAANLLTGLGGNDRLTGGLGADTLDGGAGNDRFIFATLGESPTGPAHDVILAFDGLGAAAGDLIDLAKLDADATLTGDQAFAFIGQAAFTVGVRGQLHAVASGADTLIQAEVTGDGIADFEILVKSASVSQWTAADFVL